MDGLGSPSAQQSSVSSLRTDLILKVCVYDCSLQGVLWESQVVIASTVRTFW